MTVGYPDYTRLARAGNFEFYSQSNVTPPLSTRFAQTYVGNFPYVTMFTNMAASVDFAEMVIEWYSDATFTQLVGFRIAVRGGGSFAATQYANLSDYLLIFYNTKSGNPMTFSQISIYGTQSPAGQNALESTDVPIFLQSGHINATTLQTFQIQHISPGPARMNFSCGAASWFVNWQAYSYGAGAYQTIYQANSSAFTGKNFNIALPALDCPMQIQINNGDATSQNFFCYWTGDS